MKRGMKVKMVFLSAVFSLTMLTITACGNQTTASDATQAGETLNSVEVNSLEGKIKIEGSNTMFAAADAVAGEFKKTYPNINIDIGVAGTTSGFRKLIRNKVDICNASTPMSEEQKMDSQEQGIEFLELKVGYDGVVLVVNKVNNWLDSITTDALAQIWAAESTVKKWSDVNPKWPDAEIKLYAPDGERDFFSEVVNGDASNIREDVTSSEDGKVLGGLVAAEPNAMAIMSYEYFSENKDQLKSVGIDAGNGIIQPDEASIKGLTYKPLSRQLYLYVNKKSLENEAVKKYLEFYFNEGTKLLGKTGIVPMDDYSAEAAQMK